MSASLVLSQPIAPVTLAPNRSLPILPVEGLLRKQQTLTAVDRFSREHDADAPSCSSGVYRDLIPVELPGKGQQYAFQVDLDACTGCKACVAACHSMNGLDPDEVWRSVGVLHGGTTLAATLQTVTTSCHHCLDPACLSGCPVRAYEKDPITGIVRHLDDQCFGCQYCTLMCPYDAPKFNPARGIVRKCDMCSDRLSHGEAPACVQGCPNGAISIQIVDQGLAVQTSEAGTFLPGTPTPEHTLPTTVYKTSKPMPANMLPADFYVTRPEHAHLPLVVMLVLTQLAVGISGVAAILGPLDNPTGEPSMARSACWVSATAGVLLALMASTLHLGRPWLAWRAVLGWRSSWLSREAIAFGVFTSLAVFETARATRTALPDWLTGGAGGVMAQLPGLGTLSVLSGGMGVFCSVMVYTATRREAWSPTSTGVRFFGTSVLFGAVSGLLVLCLRVPGSEAAGLPVGGVLGLVLGVSVIKLAYEGAALAHVWDLSHSTARRVAQVMLGDLRRVTAVRFAAGALGGVALPLVLGRELLPASWVPWVAGVMALAVLAGEFLERYLFFRSAPASRMPGGLR